MVLFLKFCHDQWRITLLNPCTYDFSFDYARYDRHEDRLKLSLFLRRVGFLFKDITRGFLSNIFEETYLNVRVWIRFVPGSSVRFDFLIASLTRYCRRKDREIRDANTVRGVLNSFKVSKFKRAPDANFEWNFCEKWKKIIGRFYAFAAYDCMEIVCKAYVERIS